MTRTGGDLGDLQGEFVGLYILTDLRRLGENGRLTVMSSSQFVRPQVLDDDDKIMG